MIVAVGAVILFYVIREGSFAGAGAVVDGKLNSATTNVVEPAVNKAAVQTGAALQQAGQTLKDKGSALQASSANPPASH